MAQDGSGPLHDLVNNPTDNVNPLQECQKVVDRLVEAGADPLAARAASDGATPLHLACRFGGSSAGLFISQLALQGDNRGYDMLRACDKARALTLLATGCHDPRLVVYCASVLKPAKSAG